MAVSSTPATNKISWINQQSIERQPIQSNPMLTNSSILITGGTGSFGHTFVPMTLAKFNPRRLVIYSRDEMKQWEMAKLYGDDERVRFF